MPSNQIQVKYCILGYGYASLVAYQNLLKNNKRHDILVLQQNNAKEIFTLEHMGIEFSPLPIFPVKESQLYSSGLFKDVPSQNPISVSFSELENIELDELEAENKSLADFMMKKQGVDRNLCLAMKQWGDSMLHLPFSQVQEKIKRHYISKGGNTRIGYINGRSLYSYAIEKLNPELLKYNSLPEIDIENNKIIIDGQIIQYEQLISTIPLHYLLDICDLPNAHDTTHAGAYFQFFSYDSGFNENQMIYDCDFNSDIIRIFSISDNLLLAQLGGDKHNITSNSEVASRVKELVPDIKNIEFAKELFLPMCYPLERIDAAVTLKSLESLKKNDIIPFGRFGNWEYSDLHELDLSELKELK